MLNEYQINALPERIVRRLEKINSDYLIAIGERIKEVGDLRPTEVHQLQRIYKNTRNIDAITEQLAQLSEKTEQEIYDIFDTVAKENYKYSEPFFKAQGKPFVPFSQNKELKDYVQAVSRQTVGEFKNLAQHTAFMVFCKDGEVVPTYFGMSNKVPTSLSETYTKITDLAIQKVQMGTESYQSAMREVIRTMADSGIRTVEYATGYSRRLDTAVRQNILWGVKQCNQETADMVGKAFGADGVEISYHSNPRDTHAEMGGKQYALGKAQTINGVHYPSFDTVKHLLDEPNCLHFKFSILLGVSEPAYDASELERLKENDRKTFTFEGKTYNGYEATQAQRKLETAFRHSSDRYTIAKAAGDKDMMLKEQTRMTQISQKYNEFSKTAGLPTKVERLNSGISSKSLTNRGDSGIINSKIAIANAVFVNKNEKLFRYAKKIQPYKDFEDIVCHATSTSFEIDVVGNGNVKDFISITPEEFAKRIKNSTGYHGGKIRLVSCQSGADDNGAAQQIADLLGVEVIAPTENVNVDSDGKMFLTNNEILAEMWGEAPKNEKKRFTETGRWRTFKPKKGD